MGRRTLTGEDSLQAAVVDYLAMVCRRAGFTYLAVPNGGHLSAAMGRKRKRLGARAGAPDLLIIYGGQTIQIELKTDRGRLSNSQRQWQREQYELGNKYFVCRSIDEVQSVLKGAGLIPK